jgi:hypothetical protein
MSYDYICAQSMTWLSVKHTRKLEVTLAAPADTLALVPVSNSCTAGTGCEADYGQAGQAMGAPHPAPCPFRNWCQHAPADVSSLAAVQAEI